MNQKERQEESKPEGRVDTGLAAIIQGMMNQEKTAEAEVHLFFLLP